MAALAPSLLHLELDAYLSPSLPALLPAASAPAAASLAHLCLDLSRLPEQRSGSSDCRGFRGAGTAGADVRGDGAFGAVVAGARMEAGASSGAEALDVLQRLPRLTALSLRRARPCDLAALAASLGGSGEVGDISRLRALDLDCRRPHALGCEAAALLRRVSAGGGLRWLAITREGPAIAAEELGMLLQAVGAAPGAALEHLCLGALRRGNGGDTGAALEAGVSRMRGHLRTLCLAWQEPSLHLCRAAAAAALHCSSLRVLWVWRPSEACQDWHLGRHTALQARDEGALLHWFGACRQRARLTKP